MPASKRKIYEVRDGTSVLGQFSVKTKAIAFKKDRSSEGYKVKIVTRFVTGSDDKPAVPKKSPERRRGKVSEPVPKPVREPDPEPVREPENDPEPMPISNDGEVGHFDGRTIKALARIVKGMGNPTVPIRSSSFNLISPDHIVMLSISSGAGKSLFGFDNGGYTNEGVDIVGLASSCSVGTRHSAEIIDGNLILDGSADRLVSIRDDVVICSRPRFDSNLKYDVDPKSFERELRRVERILGGGKRLAEDPAISLYGDNGDLMMSADNRGYGIDADIGDGDNGKGSSFNFQHLCLLSEMFLLSDSGCTLSMDRNMPLIGRCSFGDLDLTMYIGQLREGYR